MERLGEAKQLSVSIASDPLCELAWAHFEKSKYKAAATICEQMIEIGSRDIEISWTGLAQAMRLKGSDR